MKSFIICLENNKASLQGANQINSTLSFWGHDSNIFYGTNGITALHRLKKENRSIDKSALGFHINYLKNLKKPGVIGCFYSHFDLWHKCYELNEPILIFEDDVNLTRDFIPVSFNDILILSVDFKTFRSDEETKFVNTLKPFLHDPKGIPQSISYLCNSIQGTSGYAITPRGAKKLISKYKNTYQAVDFCINSETIDVSIHSYLMGEPSCLKSLTS